MRVKDEETGSDDPNQYALLHVSICDEGLNLGCTLNIRNKRANSVVSDEAAHYEPSHLDLNCLQTKLFVSVKKIY